jgi:hypothetical protein
MELASRMGSQMQASCKQMYDSPVAVSLTSIGRASGWDDGLELDLSLKT